MQPDQIVSPSELQQEPTVGATRRDVLGILLTLATGIGAGLLGGRVILDSPLGDRLYDWAQSFTDVDQTKLSQLSQILLEVTRGLTDNSVLLLSVNDQDLILQYERVTGNWTVTSSIDETKIGCWVTTDPLVTALFQNNSGIKQIVLTKFTEVDVGDIPISIQDRLILSGDQKYRVISITTDPLGMSVSSDESGNYRVGLSLRDGDAPIIFTPNQFEQVEIFQEIYQTISHLIQAYTNYQKVMGGRSWTRANLEFAVRTES